MVDCDNGNTVIAGATDQSYTATENGSYAVEVTVGSCVDTSACENVSNVGINDVSEEQGITIYPNPTKGMFIIDFDQKMKNSLIMVYDMVGKVIVSERISNDTTTFDLTGNEKGIYFVKIQTESGTIVRKVILQ